MAARLPSSRAAIASIAASASGRPCRVRVASRPPSRRSSARSRTTISAPPLIELFGIVLARHADHLRESALCPGLDARESILDDGAITGRDAEPVGGLVHDGGVGLAGQAALCHHHAVDTYIETFRESRSREHGIGVAAGREQRARNPCRIERIKQGQRAGIGFDRILRNPAVELDILGIAQPADRLRPRLIRRAAPAAG